MNSPNGAFSRINTSCPPGHMTSRELAATMGRSWGRLKAFEHMACAPHESEKLGRRQGSVRRCSTMGTFFLHLLGLLDIKSSICIHFVIFGYDILSNTSYFVVPINRKTYFCRSPKFPNTQKLISKRCTIPPQPRPTHPPHPKNER